MTSKNKKKKNKTHKILKGGATAMGTLNSINPMDVNEFFQTAKCFLKPWCGLFKMFEMLYTEIKFCIIMVNNVFLESGLYINNVYKHGGESSLKEIMGDVCYDIINKKTCETKIYELIHIHQLPDDETTNDILKLNKQTNSAEQMNPLLKGGGATTEPKIKPAPVSIIEPTTPNAILINSHNISVDTFFTNDKDYLNKYIIDQFKNIDIKNLYDILKCIKIMKDLLEPTIDKTENINIKEPVAIFINDVNIGSNSFNTWNLCSEYHQGKNVTKKIAKYSKEPLEKDPDTETKQLCQIENYAMYEQSSDNNINYAPVFTGCFNDIVTVLKNYYEINQKDIKKIVEKIENNDSKIDPFKDMNFKPKNQVEVEPDLTEQLKQVYKIINIFSIDELLFQIFLYKFKNLSESDKKKLTN